jgi:hypothetical protein
MRSSSSSSSSAKARAWDRIGSLFWELGRPSARPTAREVELLLGAGRTAADGPVAVIGASTRDLVLAAARITDLVIFDFSERMCADLMRELASQGVRRCRVHQMDITAPLPDEFRGRFALVASDRLINRFTEPECIAALTNMKSLLAEAGTVRASVKLGLYPMDYRMLETAAARGCATDFFDPDTCTFDYAAAGPILEESLVPHGEIPRDALLAWYGGRGAEKRYSAEDMDRILAMISSGGERVSSLPMPDAPGARLYVLE